MFALVVTLWNYKFSGHKRVIVEDVGNLAAQSFNDKTSSVDVAPGPDYDAWKALHPGDEPVAVFWEHPNFSGYKTFLPVGRHANIASNLISSVQVSEKLSDFRINAQSVPALLRLYDDQNFANPTITLIGSSLNLKTEFGFSNLTSSVKLFAGSNTKQRVRLWRDADHRGGYVEVALNMPPNDPDYVPAEYWGLGPQKGFGNVISSVEFLS